MIFEVFHYFNDTMGNNKNNIQEVKKDKLDFNTKVCRDFLQASGSVFFILLNASYNLWLVIFYFPAMSNLTRCLARF